MSIVRVRINNTIEKRYDESPHFRKLFPHFVSNEVNIGVVLKQLLQEENELHFTQFVREDAWQLGSNPVKHVIEHAMASGYHVDISGNRVIRRIFYPWEIA